MEKTKLSHVNGSILIAEFLGSRFINDAPEDYPNGYYYQPEGLEEDCPIGEPDEWYFNSSWDWLMSVYRKIRDIINERSKYDKHTRTNYDLLELDIQMAIVGINIEKAFDSIVKFIEFMNKSKTDSHDNEVKKLNIPHANSVLHTPINFGRWLLKHAEAAFDENGLLCWKYNGKLCDTDELYEIAVKQQLI